MGYLSERKKGECGHYVTGCHKAPTRRQSCCQIVRMQDMRAPFLLPFKDGHFPDPSVLSCGQEGREGNDGLPSQKLLEALKGHAEAVSRYPSCTPNISSCSRIRIVSNISRTSFFTHSFMFVIIMDIYSHAKPRQKKSLNISEMT